MGLSRLDNFLKSSRGTILYVDPGSLDSTDSIENQEIPLLVPLKLYKGHCWRPKNSPIREGCIMIDLVKQLSCFILAIIS